MLKRVKEYKKINAERIKEQARKRYNTPEGRKVSVTRTNNYRAKKKQLLNDLTVEQWNECLNYFNHSCAYCGEQHESLEQEHFISVSKGGAFTKTNIVTACRSCNASKYNQDFFEWFKQQEYYSIEREKRILSYLGREIKK
ncbi:hypothetical protein CMV37_03515 [Bacillus cereus]|nr:hypothetical protein CMV37_03515 [Bacillus cereus]